MRISNSTPEVIKDDVLVKQSEAGVVESQNFISTEQETDAQASTGASPVSIPLIWHEENETLC